ARLRPKPPALPPAAARREPPLHRLCSLPPPCRWRRRSKKSVHRTNLDAKRRRPCPVASPALATWPWRRRPRLTRGFVFLPVLPRLGALRETWATRPGAGVGKTPRVGRAGGGSRAILPGKTPRYPTAVF